MHSDRYWAVTQIMRLPPDYRVACLRLVAAGSDPQQVLEEALELLEASSDVPPRKPWYHRLWLWVWERDA